MDTSRRVPKLMLVTDRRRAVLPLSDLAARAVAGGVDVVQIREKDLSDERLMSLASSVLSGLTDHSRVSVNCSLAVASALEIGLHLPESGPAIDDARQVLGPDVLIGRSVHTPKSARESLGADYLIAGHVFPTTSKPDQPPIGLDGLLRVVETAPCPVLAIGGVTAENVRSILSVGAHGAAVISAINGAADPATAARAIREQMQGEGTFPMSVATTIEVTINGKPVAIEPGTTVLQFLHSKGYEDRLVVVELNEAILPRPSYPSTTLAAADRVEIVHFVGGG
jgi:thiamine biosynthesis protein ThiS